LEVTFEPAGEMNVMELAVALGAWFTAPAEEVTPLAEHPPPGDLGEPYAIEWSFVTDDGVAVVHQSLFLFAEGGATVYTPPAPEVAPVGVGWYEAPPELYAVLFDIGLPQTILENCRSSDREGPAIVATVGFIVVASVAAFVAGLGIGQRRLTDASRNRPSRSNNHDEGGRL
jgi:hypothetical protein